MTVAQMCGCRDELDCCMVRIRDALTTVHQSLDRRPEWKGMMPYVEEGMKALLTLEAEIENLRNPMT